MIKFNRNYSLRIATDLIDPASLGVNNSFITIEPPFTMEFDITRSVLTSANVCQIRIYNLAEINRNQIRHNAYDYGSYKRIEFKAGYGANLATVFHGNISQAFSTREGTNFITTIECYDGGYGYVNGEVDLQFSAGTPFKAVITQIAATLKSKGVSIGAIGNYPGVLTRDNSYSGDTMSILTELTGGGAFIDNGKFYALSTNEYIASLSSVGVINSQSGLLGTPRLERDLVTFDMLFEPGLNIGHKILLDSGTGQDFFATTNGVTSNIGPGFNGEYIVKAVKHRGMISNAVCGNAVTTGTFFFSKSLEGVQP